MANLIEAAAELEYVPKDQLAQMINNPDAGYPSYLVLSEIQRRTQMEKIYNAERVAMEKPSTTVAEEVVADFTGGPQGLAGGAQDLAGGPQGLAGVPPSSSEITSSGGMPALMAQGGRTGYQNNGRTSLSRTFDNPYADMDRAGRREIENEYLRRAGFDPENISFSDKMKLLKSPKVKKALLEKAGLPSVLGGYPFRDVWEGARYNMATSPEILTEAEIISGEKRLGPARSERIARREAEREISGLFQSNEFLNEPEFLNKLLAGEGDATGIMQKIRGTGRYLEEVTPEPRERGALNTDNLVASTRPISMTEDADNLSPFQKELRAIVAPNIKEEVGPEILAPQDNVESAINIRNRLMEGQQLEAPEGIDFDTSRIEALISGVPQFDPSKFEVDFDAPTEADKKKELQVATLAGLAGVFGRARNLGEAGAGIGKLATDIQGIRKGQRKEAIELSRARSANAMVIEQLAAGNRQEKATLVTTLFEAEKSGSIAELDRKLEIYKIQSNLPPEATDAAVRLIRDATYNRHLDAEGDKVLVSVIKELRLELADRVALISDPLYMNQLTKEQQRQFMSDIAEKRRVIDSAMNKIMSESGLTSIASPNDSDVQTAEDYFGG